VCQEIRVGCVLVRAGSTVAGSLCLSIRTGDNTYWFIVAGLSSRQGSIQTGLRVMVNLKGFMRKGAEL